MKKTPQKSGSLNLNTSLTPVYFRDSQSPRAQSNDDSNLAVCRTRLETLVKNLQDNYAKWQLAQQRGSTLCYAIEAKKTRCLEATASDTSSYPDELKMPCDKLAVIASIFVDIANNTRETLRQLRALQKLPGTSAEVIFYRSWRLRQFVAFAQELLQRYDLETAVKQQVMAN
ncbi:uncharacterized protein LOC115631580 isoform X2 [Scaptodrosophila lebanonensis]|uniref:Uncharacterized protein LOC115631580 isoform X2 n=1 Tax=Drosophila lebanonensis TaxID=7225 RepID=A0A6J2UAP7_DROLE|nr:uncharacterized protein LOC115631580 isoform X2 [Scaptodrosophila lebanonensis]